MTTQASIENKAFTGIRVKIETPVSFEEVLGRLRHLSGRVTIPEIVALAQKAGTEADYIREVEARFVGESGFMLFSEINHGEWISKFGIQRKVLRWILGNPLIAITMLRHDIAAGLFAPVELLLTERVDGQGSILFYVRPSSLIVIDDTPDLLAAAKALDDKLAALVEHATNA